MNSQEDDGDWDDGKKKKASTHKLKTNDQYQDEYNEEMKFGITSKRRGRKPRNIGDISACQEANREEKLSDNLKRGQNHLQKTLERESEE